MPLKRNDRWFWFMIIIGLFLLLRIANMQSMPGKSYCTKRSFRHRLVRSVGFLARRVPSHHGNRHCFIRLLSKPAATSEVRGNTERRTTVYTLVHEDLSTVSTKQFADAVGFGKKSIQKSQLSS
jgi:RPE1 domain-containing protein